MPAFNILDLPSGVFLYIINFVKDEGVLTPLRLVCRSFNIHVCEAMFDTLVINGGPHEDPLDWPHSHFDGGIIIRCVNRLTHQLDTLYTKKQPAALRRAKRLKILVSEVFDYSKRTRLEPALRKELQSAVHHITIKLPSIIRTLENVRETTVYLGGFEHDEFTRNISNALLTLPHLSILDVKFLDQNLFRSLPIVGSPRLVTLKISWPLEGRDLSFLSGHESGPIYSEIFGFTAKNTSLKCLELCSANLLLPEAEPYQLCALPCLEELAIDNVPILLSGDIVKEMRELQSLQLAYGRFTCPDGELCTEVWKSLKEAGTKLKHLSIDMVGEALLTYLCSYAGLETLELTLDRDAEYSYAQDLFERSLRHHEESLKSLRVYLPRQSNPLSTWFFEYWKEWIPPFQILEELEVTTSMNLFSEHDARVLLKNTTDVVALIPTLRIVKVRHLYEDHVLFSKDKTCTRVVEEGVESIWLHRDFTPVLQCGVDIYELRWTFRVVFHREEGYGSLKLVTDYRG